MTTDIIQTSGVVSPDVEGTVNALKKFLELKEEVLQENDTVMISGKKYIKRSGWRKIALAFNVSTEIISVERDYGSDLKICHVKARAIAPNGRISEEIASCDSTEFIYEDKDNKKQVKFTIHNMETKAATRAINRAISNLVGGGEVSAEEIEQGENASNNGGNETTNGSSIKKGQSGNTDFNPEKKEPASMKQKNFIKSMMENMNLEVDYDALDKMTKFEAHDRIEQLKKQMDGAKA
jgi:hypothetical protein